jgi:hypothetical protein
LRQLEHGMQHGRQEIVLATLRRRDVLPQVFQHFAELGIRVRQVEWIDEDHETEEATFRLRLAYAARETDLAQLVAWLSDLPGVRRVTLE